MASLVYNVFKRDIQAGLFSLSADTVNVILVTSAYTPSASAHSTYADITNEATGTGYTTSGATLSSINIYLDGDNSKAIFDAGDVTWTGATVTARYAVIYKKSNTPATSKLITCVDFGSSKSSLSSDFTIQWNSSGILQIT